MNFRITVDNPESAVSNPHQEPAEGPSVPSPRPGAPT